MSLAMAKRKSTTWTPKRIKALQLALTEHFGWTQREIATKVGASARTWRTWGAGTREPSGSAQLLLNQLLAKLPAEKRPE